MDYRRSFTILLSSDDKVHREFIVKNGKLTDFVIQYHSKVKGGWRTILRYDTSHGYAHKHIYHLKRKNNRKIILSSNADEYSKIYNEAIKHLKNNFDKIKRNYLL